MLAIKIIGGGLLVLLILLLCPLRLEVAFEDQFFLTLRYLFLRIPLVPGKEKPEEPAEEEEAKEEREGEEGESALDKLKAIVRRTGFSGFVKSLLQLAGLAVSSAKRLFSHLRWKRFDLYLRVGGAQDAGAAAIQYGELSAGVYPAVALLLGKAPPRQKGVTVDLDYDQEENLVRFSAKLSLLPIFAAREACSLLIHGVPILWKLLRPPKGARVSRKEGTEGAPAPEKAQKSDDGKVRRYE